MKQLFFLCALLLAMSLFGAPAKDASRGVDIKSAVSLSVVAESTNAAGANDAIYASPGKLVSADGTRLNLYCRGSGSPTVVFDSGWEDWAPAWSKVQPEVAKFTRACSYDRAGAGFSDPGPMPRTSVRIAQELHSALRNTGAKGPYILVGHAFGGDNVRTFANLYMREVAGLVLVEADPDDLLPKQMQEDNHRGHAKLLVSVRECRDAVAAGSPCRRCRHVPDRRNAPALSSSFAVCPRRHGPPN